MALRRLTNAAPEHRLFIRFIFTFLICLFWLFISAFFYGTFNFLGGEKKLFVLTANMSVCETESAVQWEQNLIMSKQNPDIVI